MVDRSSENRLWVDKASFLLLDVFRSTPNHDLFDSALHLCLNHLHFQVYGRLPLGNHLIPATKALTKFFDAYCSRRVCCDDRYLEAFLSSAKEICLHTISMIFRYLSVDGQKWHLLGTRLGISVHFAHVKFSPRGCRLWSPHFGGGLSSTPLA